MHGNDSFLVSSSFRLTNISLLLGYFSGDFDLDAQEADSLATIAKALELGINLLDTAWIYQVNPLTTRCSCNIHRITRRIEMANIILTKIWWAKPSKFMVVISSSLLQSLELVLRMVKE
jgi:aryl-alcohol dehydrogenase-like predicted oxidoreductase